MRWVTVFGIGSVSLGTGALVGLGAGLLAGPWVGLGVGCAVFCVVAGGLTLWYKDDDDPPLSDQQRSAITAEIDRHMRQVDAQQDRLDRAREPQQQAQRNTQQVRSFVRHGQQPQYHSLNDGEPLEERGHDSPIRDATYDPRLIARQRQPPLDENDVENLFLVDDQKINY